MNLIEKFKNYFSKDKIKELEAKIEKISTEIIEKPIPIKSETKLVSKVMYNLNNKEITVVFSNGNVLSGNVEREIYEKIKNCDNELLIITLLTPEKKVEEVKGNDFDIDVQSIITPLVNILSKNENFEVDNGKVYLKGIKSLEIPTIIVSEFIRLSENLEAVSVDNSNLDKINLYEEEFNSLLMFTSWLLMNPIESARQDCLTFVKKNNIPITSNGMLVTFRRVVSTGIQDKKLIKFISESYFKIKKWKKSVNNYKIVAISDDYELKKLDFNVENTDYICLGNLNLLYNSLSERNENTFTDSHTKKKVIKLGEIYKEDEDKINLDNSVACGAGLHSGSWTFGFDGFGDISIICLINPSKVRSVPKVETNKLRSSELFPVAIIDFEDYKEYVNSDDILNMSELYCNESIDELNHSLKSKSFDSISCQDNYPSIAITDLVNITKLLKQRIVRV